MLGTRLIATHGDGELANAARRVSAKISAVTDDDASQTYARLPLRAVSRQTEEGMKARAHLGCLRSAVS